MLIADKQHAAGVKTASFRKEDSRSITCRTKVMDSMTLDALEAHPKKKVLLVDNEEAILESLSHYLKYSRLHVETATSARQALRLFKKETFDLIITDLVMNGMSGMELLSEIKKIKYDSGVFILTGQGNMGSVIDAIRLSADDYLLKPCDADELIFRMERFFEKQDALRKIKVYEKFLPICMYCKMIRDDAGVERGAGTWLSPEEYLKRKNSDLRLSHGCCPDCFEKHKDEWFKS
jgi:YesN/AraC family two-component response regulator